MKYETGESKKKKVRGATWYDNEIKAPSCKPTIKTKTKGQQSMARVRREERDGWGNLGNKKADPDDRSCRNLAPTMARTWEGWEQTGATDEQRSKEGGGWGKVNLYITSVLKIFCF